MTPTTKSLLCLIVMALFIASSCGSGIAQEAPGGSASGTFLWISDIHFDPYYPFTPWNHRDSVQVRSLLSRLVDRSDQNHFQWKDHTLWGNIFSGSPLQSKEYSMRGFDTNDTLLQAALTQAQHVSSTPDFILITGDLLGHNFGASYSRLAPAKMQTGAHYTAFVAQTLKYIARSVRNRFAARIPIYATLGNNDAYCGDYDIRLDHTNSTFLKDTADTFLQYFLQGLSPSDQQAFGTSFLKGGYYTVSLPAGNTNRLIVLNSIPFMGPGSYPTLWSAYSETQTTCANSPLVDAADQLHWFDSLTTSAPAGHAWVAAHVPPGIACYDNTTMWATNHLNTYKGVFLKSGAALKLAGTLVAHSHMASFKLLRDANKQPASIVLQGPSVSPNHSNNPAFRVVTYDSNTLEISDYRTHYLDLNTGHWRSFSFRETYGQHPVTTTTLQTLYDEMQSDVTTWDKFVHNYGSSAGAVVGLGQLSQTNLQCLGSLGN